MTIKIEKVLLNEKEIPIEKVHELYNKYIIDYMTRECFLGGITVVIPEGNLRAIVKPIF